MANSAPDSIFCRKAVEFPLAIQGGGIEPHADHGEGLRIDRLPSQIDALVEPLLHGGHADGIGVENAGGVGVVAQLGRIAGDEEDIPHAAGRTGQEVGLHADQVAVAAAEMEDGLDLGHAEDPLGGD